LTVTGSSAGACPAKMARTSNSLFAMARQLSQPPTASQTDGRRSAAAQLRMAALARRGVAGYFRRIGL
jgi:hypothetical protein